MFIEEVQLHYVCDLCDCGNGGEVAAVIPDAIIVLKWFGGDLYTWWSDGDQQGMVVMMQPAINCDFCDCDGGDQVSDCFAVVIMELKWYVRMSSVLVCEAYDGNDEVSRL